MQGQTYGSVRFSEGGNGSNPEDAAAANRRDNMQRSQSAAGASFLRTVKKVQVARRMEKLAKMRSESHINSVGQHQEGQEGGMLGGPPPTKDEDERHRLLAASGASEHSVVAITSGSMMKHLIQIITGKGVVSACLLAGPLALVANAYGWSDTVKFWLNFVTMIPLASILGDFTEEVALHTNETIGGLINATFGNAVEVVVAIQALVANEIRVVQSSMLGSIFSNLLLVLGGCFFCGGLKYKHQQFNATAATANMGLLALSGIALVLPTPFAHYYEMHDEHVLLISRLAAIFLMFMYVQLLVFQLHTHATVFAAEEVDDANVPGELASLSFQVSIMGLLVTTLLVTIFSEFLVDSIDGFTASSGISRTFVGIILLPIVGNAVEHITAITVAMKDKMDLAMGIAVGSCTQISLFVVPLTVLVGWMIDRDMTLNFPHFEVILFVLSIFTVSVVLSNPSSHWLEGSLLMTTYVLIGVGFWFEDVQAYTN